MSCSIFQPPLMKPIDEPYPVRFVIAIWIFHGIILGGDEAVGN